MEEAGAQVPERAVVHRCSGGGARGFDLVRIEQAEPDQFVRIDQIGVSGESRQALVGRIAEAGRPQRAHLPAGKTGFGEQIDEIPRRGAERADPRRPRQGGRMQQHAAPPVVSGTKRGASFFRVLTQVRRAPEPSPPGDRGCGRTRAVRFQRAGRPLPESAAERISGTGGSC